MPLLPFLGWFSLLVGAGWLFLPLSLRIFGGALPDGGLAIGRILFLATWTLGAFWAGQAGLSTRGGVYVGVAMGLVGVGAWIRGRGRLQSEIKARQRAIWASEGVFVAVFLAFFVLRGFWSDTAGTNGEKGMDSALIASLVRAERLPPPNPFAAGATLQSYYYLGHLQSALLSSAVDAPVRWSYNWMCATLPALCFAGLFSLGAALTQRLRGGLFIAVAVLGLGTLQPIFQWVRPDLFTPNAPFRLYHFGVSRVIPYSINEFPFFTFVQADLHAHLFALPLAIATMSLGWAIFQGRRAAMVMAPLLLGAQILTNTWDFPVYALLIALAICLAPQTSEKVGKWKRVALIALIWGGALLLAAPYLGGIRTAAAPPRPLPFPASPMREWGLLWGLFALGWVAFLSYAGDESRGRRVFFAAFGALFGVYALAVPWQRPDPFVLPLIVFLLGFSVVGAGRLRGAPRFLCCLAIGGLIALTWSETTWAGFLGDPNNPGFDDYKRQDTVFKFGMQTWMLWGVAASCGAALTFPKWPRVLRAVSMPLLGVMAIASFAAMFGRARGFSQWDGWDGWAHLAPGEKRAASWLLQNARGGENLLEAEQKEGGDYSEYPRYAGATGIATVVGPQAHTFQWSPANSGDAGQEWGEVTRRKALARSIYLDWRGAARREAMQTCGARFILFGELEREQYGEANLQTLLEDAALTPVAHFNNPPEFAIEAGKMPRDVWIFRIK